MPQRQIAQEAAVLLEAYLDPADLEMTGFEAKKVGERISQASSAASQSATGSVGSRTKASSDRAGSSAPEQGWRARSSNRSIAVSLTM